MSRIRQFFADATKSIKIYPRSIAKAIDVHGGGTVQDYLDGSKTVPKAHNTDTWCTFELINEAAQGTPSYMPGWDATMPPQMRFYNPALMNVGGALRHNGQLFYGGSVVVNPAGKNYAYINVPAYVMANHPKIFGCGSANTLGYRVISLTFDIINNRFEVLFNATFTGNVRINFGIYYDG